MNRKIFIILILAAILGCATNVHQKNSNRYSGAKSKNYLVHTIKPGETLSEIAIQYYGTIKKYDTMGAIKKFNNIINANDLKAGRKIKIPVLIIEGIKKPEGPGLILTEPETPEPETPKEEGRQDYIMLGTKSLDENDYEKAILYFKKALDKEPDNTYAKKYLSVAYFQQAIMLFENKKYVEAQKGFKAVLNLKKNCKECGQYLKAIEKAGRRYEKKGIKLYGKKKYKAAISELERANDIVRNKKNIKKYLFMAHFDLAMKQFGEYQNAGGDDTYGLAVNSLEKAYGYKNNCRPCSVYMEKYKRSHYNKGIKYFTNKKKAWIEKAIREWEKVKFVDPGYKKVIKNIKEAKELLARLKEI